MPYIEENGIQWSRNDIDSEDAGELSDGSLRRNRINMRRKLTVKLKNFLTNAEMSTIQKAIYPQWVRVEFNDALEGQVITRSFYSNNVPATIARANPETGEIRWQGFAFPLIEKGDNI